MTEQIADPLTFIDEHYETHQVLGKDIKFRAVSIDELFKLRLIATPMARAIAVLFAPTSGDIGTVHREVAADPDSLMVVKDQVEGMEIGDKRTAVFLQMVASIKNRETIIEPMSVDLATKRGDDQAKAIGELIDVMTNPQAKEVVASIILDSIKKDMYPEGTTAPTVEAFSKRITGPSLYGFIVGVMKINKGTLGPLASALGGGQLTAIMTAAARAMQARVAQVGQGVAADEKADETDQPETDATETTPTPEPTPEQKPAETIAAG